GSHRLTTVCCGRHWRGSLARLWAWSRSDDAFILRPSAPNNQNTSRNGWAGTIAGRRAGRSTLKGSVAGTWVGKKGLVLYRLAGLISFFPAHVAPERAVRVNVSLSRSAPASRPWGRRVR